MTTLVEHLGTKGKESRMREVGTGYEIKYGVRVRPRQRSEVPAKT